MAVQSGRIHWLGRWRDCEVPAGVVPIDLGEVVLMPGLIDSHCHLDYTNMAGQIPPPRAFPDWVMNILSYKAHWSFSEFAESWLNGARMLLNTGTTTVVDTESVPELPAQTWHSTPLRMVSLLEMTGVRSQRPADEILEEALDWIDRWPKDGRKEAGLSPHALYSTSPALMHKAAEVARERGLLVSTHLAESESEHLMYTERRGPLFDWLKGQRKMDDCGQSPIRLAKEYGLLNDRLLVIHANYLGPLDIEDIAQSRASVVHCPRSHDYFGHARFPYESLSKADINICLATDSLASARRVQGQNPELNLWKEMQLFAGTHPSISPQDILRMVTLNPAQALHKEGQLGALEKGAWADLVSLHYTGALEAGKISEELLHTAPVREVMISGDTVRPAA